MMRKGKQKTWLDSIFSDYFSIYFRLDLQQQLVDRLQQVVVQNGDFEPNQMAAVFTFIARQMTKPDAKIVINRMLIEQVI